MSGTVSVSMDGAVARVALNRPEVRNAFNAAMIAELTQLFEDLRARSDVRAIVLSGNGSTFSAGADVSWMQASLERSEDENVADARQMSAMFAAIQHVPQPVVGQVHGACLGGGMGLIAVCDCVVAADDAVFGFTEVKLGVIPAVISAFVLPKIGESWSRALFLTGEQFSVDLAQRIGLVHWVTSGDELQATVESKVDEILTAGPRAVRDAKQLVFEQRGLSVEERGELTAQRIATVRARPEGQEGLRAFLEKRRPSWRQSR